MAGSAEQGTGSGGRPPALAGIRLLFSTAAATDRTGLVASLGLSLLASLLLPLYPLVFKLLVDAAAQERSQRMVLAAAAMAALSATTGAMTSYAWMLGWNLWERMTVTIDEQLVTMAGRIGLVDRVERPAYLEHLTLVRTNREHFQESMMSLLNAVFLGIQVVVTVLILATVAPVLLLLPLFSAAPIAAGRWAESRSQQALRDSAEDTRAADGFAFLAIEAPSAGELRVLRLRDLVIQRHQAAWERALRRQWRAETVGAAVSAAALMLFTLGFGGAVLYMTVESLHGHTTVGSVILVLTAGQQLHNQIGGVLASSGDLFKILETVRNYSWLVRYVDENEERGTIAPPETLRRGIALERVSFRYAGASRNALEDVTMTLPAGAVVAVVGENGAGKSTLVSLLCGLHRPTSGRILVDGVDLADLHAQSWRDRLSGAFQDFVRFEVLARESIGVASILEAARAEPVRAALRRADVSDLEGELPDGLETGLGRAFLDGIDLSGGQWQKVALGRSMMRPVPTILVLDEPTYSLDVQSERRVYEWFSRISASENPTGMITVIVSHRFSSVRAADVVAVIHDGRLIEWGSHEELIARGGRYASMYRIQAEGYR